MENVAINENRYLAQQEQNIEKLNRLNPTFKTTGKQKENI